MKHIITFIFIYLLFTSACIAQDTIVEKNGTKVVCRILKEDSSTVSFTIIKNGKGLSTYLNKNDIQSIHYYQPTKLIILVNKTTGEIIPIRKNEKIKMVFSNNDKTIYGKIVAIKDSTLKLNNDSIIKFADIQTLYLNPITTNLVIGYILLGVGSFGIGSGLFFVIDGLLFAFGPVNMFVPNFFGFIIAIVGIPMTIGGYFSGRNGLKLLKKSTYSMQEWKLKVIAI